jgi:LPXTG-motif cell wall-anchored protein
MFARSISTSSISNPSRVVSSWWNRRSTATGLALALFAGSVSVAVVGNSSPSIAEPPAEVTQLANVTNDNSASDPAEMTLLGNNIIFRACDDDRGCELWKSDADGSDPALLKDINPDGSSSPTGITVVGNIAYFSADNGATGIELWKTDGTAAGTTLILDIYSGSSSSSPNTFKQSGALVFFYASDISGNSVWVTNGTAVSTRKVGGIEIATQASTPASLVQLNGMTYFRADDGVHGPELWISDGTPQGSRMVKDINPGNGQGADQIYALGGRIFFRGNDGVRGWELWTTDGTEEGTRMVKNINPNGDSSLEYLTFAAGKWFFRANDMNCCDQPRNGQTGQELYVTDGTTAGTRLVKDISSNTPSNNCWWCYGPTNLKALTNGIIFQQDDVVNGNIWYRSDGTTAGTTSLDPNLSDQMSSSEPIVIGGKAYFQAGNTTTGVEPWVTDGSTAGTHIIADVNTNNQSSNINNLTRIGTTAKYVFSSSDGIHGEELWVTDFTTAGTHMVRELQTGTENSGQSSPSQFYAAGDKVFFRAFSDATGWELWVTDGTSAGTRAIDLNPGRPDSYFDQVYGLNGKLVFRFHQGVGYGVEPWISDGTDAGTRMIKDFNPSGDSSLDYAIESGGKIYLKINDLSEPHYGALWVTDGTSANTIKLTSRCANQGNPDPQSFTAVDNGLLVRLNDCVYGHKWWRTDGTVAGTARLDPSYNPLTTQWGDVGPFLIGGKYYFTATSPETGNELWTTDGSPSGTRVLKDINTAESGSDSSIGIKLGNKWIFTANDGIHGYELWVSDGTVAGTSMLLDINTGAESSGNSSPQKLVLAGNKVFFRAFDETAGWEMFATDGTTAGTTMIDLNPGRTDTDWDQFYGLNGRMVFRLHTTDTSHEPWISDGTVAGTHLIKDINPSGQTELESAIESNGKIYMKLNDYQGYRAVWVTDGTAENTIKLTSRCGNNGDPDPTGFTPVDGGILMRLYDCQYNHKWWRTDGTVAGTARLDPSYNPLTTQWGDVSPTQNGGKYYFTAVTPELGNELWVTDGSPSGTRVVKDINTGNESSNPATYLKVGNKYFYSANDGINGLEIWVTDGTVSGTRMLKNFNSTSENSGNVWWSGTFYKAGNRAVFALNDIENGYQLWASDGTEFGTVRLTNTSRTYDYYFDSFTAIGSKLIFRARTSNERNLWITDGTTAGTFELMNINSGDDNWSGLFTDGNSFVARANDGSLGDELLYSDGTQQGTRILDINVGGSSSFPQDFKFFGDKLLFRAQKISGQWDWHYTNGTLVGTARLDPDTSDGIALTGEPVVIGSKVYYIGTDADHGAELWKSDGTIAGTTLVKDIYTGSTGSGVNPLNVIGTKLYFSATDDTNGHEPWVSDGTTAGTKMMVDLNPGAGTSGAGSFSGFANKILYRANTGSGIVYHATDATTFATESLGYEQCNGLSNEIGNRLIVTLVNPATGCEPAITDGTTAGTTFLGDLYPGSNSSSSTLLAATPTKVYFRATDGTYGDELWVTDGTIAGTLRLSDFVVGAGGTPFSGVSVVGDGILFQYCTCSNWVYGVSDGTIAGTHALNLDAPTSVGNLGVVGNRVVFSSKDSREGTEMFSWSSVTGVTSSLEINPHTGSEPSYLVSDGTTAVFTANGGEHGNETWITDGTSAGTRLYADANVLPSSSNADSFFFINGTLYFRAVDFAHGSEIWKTDGTANGTQLVKDISVGATSSGASFVGQVGNKAYFTAWTASTGSELWVTDGTTLGTRMIKEINTVTQPNVGNVELSYFYASSERLFFRAYDGTTRDLWMSDGTSAGTTKIDLRAGVDDPDFDYGTVAGTKFYFRSRDDLEGNTGQALYSVDGVTGNLIKLMTMTGVGNEYPYDIKPVGNSVVFGMYNAPSPNGGWQFWMSNGTIVGTGPFDTTPNDTSYVQTYQRFDDKVAYRFDDGVHGNEWRILNGTTGVVTLLDLNPYGSSNIDSEFVDGNVLRFRADDGAHGNEWWVSDGTVAGTRMYSDANTSGASSNPDQFTLLNGVTYFRATDPVRGAELWKTDGTSAGTVLVKDMYPGSVGSDFSLYGVTNNKLFMYGRNGINEDYEPWVSDGTTNGTTLLKVINPTTNSNGQASVDSVVLGLTHTYFRAFDGTTRDIWITDGTPSGTTKVDFAPGVDDYVDYQAVAGNKFYFRYRDDIANGTGSAYYVSDGTPGNMTKLVTMSGRTNAHDYPSEPRAVGNTLLFRWYNYPTQNNTWQWWMSDGTAQGTVPLDSLSNDFVAVTDITFFGTSAFYVDDDGINGRELWLLNGLTGVRSRTGLRNADQFIVEGSRIRFRADDGVHGLEYWTSDGTIAGTQMVKDINQIGATSNPNSFVKMGNHIYFLANDGVRGIEVWKTDGTSQGTSRISNIGTTDWYDGDVSDLVATSDQLFFAGVDPVARKELFVSDGTLAGTRMVKDINPDNGWCWWCLVQIDSLKVINNKVVFRAGNNTTGREMWVSDGTANGTFMLEDSNLGPANSEADQFVVAGNKLFYRAQDGTGNYRLKSTNGTVAGTHTINYRSDNGGASGINDFRAVGNNALLWLEDGVYGWQWWFSDGTNAGTYLLDPHPSDGSWPELVTVSGNKVFFRTHDTNNDRELYVADASGVTRLGNIRLSGSSEPDQLSATPTGIVFTADTDLYGREPWTTDGTIAGTRLISDVNQRAGNVSYGALIPVSGKVIYQFNDGVHGWQIVASDGTAQGTGVVPINPSGDPSSTDLLSLGSKAFFSAVNPQNDRQLYVSDGTVVGTTVVRDINASGNDNVGSLAVINGLVYFAADDGTNGRELWVTDGTVGGTRMLADLNSSGGSDPSGFTLSNGKIYFNAWESTKGRELYVTNGTTNGTVSLGDLNPYGDSSPDRFTAAGLKTVFRAFDSQRGWELWVTDGTVGGTQILADLNPRGDSDPQNITAVNGKAIFSGYDGSPSEGGRGREAWVTDGTVAGTQMIEINTSATMNSGNSDPSNFTALGSRILFSAYNSSRSRELWVTDGTAAGTRMFDMNTFGGGIWVTPIGAGSNTVWAADDGMQIDGKHGNELWISNGTASGTSLVDINQTSWYNGGNSYPGEFIKNGNLTFFTARNATNGNELWQTDGTAAGSTLVADINPNTENSNADNFVVAGSRYFFRAYTPQYGWELFTSTSATGSATLVKDIRVDGDSWPDSFTVSGNKMYFRADDGIRGREIWVTDGTSAGTQIAKDICPFSYDCGSSIQSAINGGVLIQANDSLHGYQHFFTDGTVAGTQPLDNNLDAGGNAESPVVLGNKIVFVLDNGSSGREIWYYDTATGGRGMLKDIRTGGEGSRPDSLTKVGNYVYFRADDGTDGLEIWRTDGTGAGTIMLANAHPTGDGNPDYFTQVGSKMFFRSEDGVNGRVLWVTDGTTAGTLKMNNFPWAESLVAGATKLFYRSYNPTQGWELWVSDGTPAGTRVTKDLNNSNTDTWMDNFITAGDQLFFRANDGVTGVEVATSDGTEAGTFMLGDLVANGDSNADYFVPMGNGKMLFRIDDGTTPTHRNLWFTNGTIAGTRQITNSYIADSRTGAWAANPENIVYLPSTGKAYFRGWDITNGYELWTTDGTVAGTQILKSINALGDSTPSSVTVLGDKILMNASNGSQGQEPWISDGTAAGTIALGDVNTVGASSDPNWFTKTTNRMFFSADNFNNGRELWVKDANGTRMVVDKNPFGYGNPDSLAAVGDNVVYRYNDGIYGNELWFSDGTANGTIRLTDGVTNGDSNPDRVTSFGNKAVFRMYDPTNGWEPWITDGTTAGSFMLKDIRVSGDSDPGEFTMVGSKMFFTADDGIIGRQLWVTDGTSNGTIALPANTSGTSNVSSLTAVGNTLYYSADDGVNGYELWTSDGTIGGTTMVKDIRTGALNSSPQQLTVNGSSLYFTAVNDTQGRELWKSNGTSNGTTMVADINIVGNSNPEQLVVDGSLLYFVANDGVSGREPFVSDGTANGTGSIDINRSGGSRPDRLARHNNILYFTANDGFNGSEMWAVNGSWLASTAPNVTRSENAPLPPSGVSRPVPSTSAPVLTTAPSTTEAPSVETSAPETSTPGSSNPNSSSPEPTVPNEVPTTASPTTGSETSAPATAAPNTSPRVLTPPPAGSSTPSVIPVAEARQLEQDRGRVSARINGEDVEISQVRITGSGISSDQRDRSPSVIAEIRAQARQLVAAFDSFLPNGVTSEISVVDSPNGAKILGLMVDPNNPSVSIPIPAEAVILITTPSGALLMGGLNNAGRPSYVNQRGALVLTKGGSVGLSISGLPVNQNGELIIMSTPQSLGGFVVDEHGLFEGQVKIPASLPFGTHTLLVAAGNMTVAVGVMVDNAVPLNLPATGSDSENPLTVALFWVLMGLGLLMVRRRFKMGRN